ncbi:MAG: carboxypeptidase regulatory-like domain-containing protein [Bacteroidota bacterium]
MIKRILCLCVSLVAFMALGSSLMAQGVTSATLRGVVADNNGAALEGATVIAVHTPTGTRYGAITRDAGRFNIPNVRVGGPYTITAKYVGYRDNVQEGIYLQLGQRRNVNFEMTSADVELEEVVITSTTGILSSERTGAETVVTEEQINTLPTVARAIGDFTRLTPQATVTEGNDGFSISLNGQNNRYNAIYIDGAVNNDVFGLAGSGTNGGQTGVSPVSLDAIESFQISLAPFDVRVGGFSGGAINAVTRSGSNNVEASVYSFFRDEAFAGQTPTDNELVERTRLADFSARTTGFRIGAPIVKDKLFFFFNAEQQRDETPQPFQFEDYQGDATVTQLEELRQQIVGLGYEPGAYDDSRSSLNSDKITAKLDWNANENNTVSLRHSFVRAENLEGVQSNNQNIRFLNSSEFFKSTTNSTALEWNSIINEKFSNNLKVGVTIVNDDRDPFQGDDPRDENDNPNYFPYVNIDDGGGNITFGSEQFSTANALDQTIITITDNFTIYSGRHSLTIGTHNEFFDVYNLFIRQNYGVYEYDSLQQFLNGDPASLFIRSYSLVDDFTGDGSQAASDFSGAQFGFYVQDEFQVSPNFTLTGGLRFDIPVYFTDVRTNNDFNDRTIPLLEAEGYDLMGAQTGDFIPAQFLISPRVGFNWDVNGDMSTILRGGVGIFTSRIPLVWPGGAYNNNGFTVGGDFTFNPGFGVHDNPDWDNQPQAVQAGQGQPSGQIDLFADDFKVPQVLKLNVALDQKLPWGMVGNLDVIYNKTLNNVLYQNLNLRPSSTTLTGTPDDRILYDRGDEIDPTYSRIMLASNTNEGYTYNLTASITKPFDNGFTAMLAYSFGDAFAVFDGTSSQNSSQWRGLHAINGRNFDQVNARSDFSQGHRVLGTMSYKLKWNEAGNAATTIAIFYEGLSGRPYSYIYNDGGRLNNEDSRERSLIFVPQKP